MAQLASAAGSTSDRAQHMLQAVRRLVPFDAAWIASTAGGGYTSLASSDLGDAVVNFLSGPKMALDIQLTGTNRWRPPLSPSDLPYPADELATWAESLIPAGIHEALAVALFEPGGRHVGFLALLYGDRRPPTPSARRRLAHLTELLAQGIDPMASLTVASRLVSDAFAGILLFDEGQTQPLPGLPGDELLTLPSVLLETVRARLIPGETHMSFLWARRLGASTPEHVRATYVGMAERTLPDLRGMVVLSQAGAVHRLTSRELQVLGMLIDGCSNHEIADRMMVAVRTVAAHVEHILVKLGSPSRTHAAVQAQREGLYIPAPVR